MPKLTSVFIFLTFRTQALVAEHNQCFFFYKKKTLIVPETIPFSSSPKTAVLPFKAIFLLLKKSMGDRYSVG